ncbi:ras-related protein Rab-26-like [Zeugodacus cucurbitae]|uniref:ras-related protein Rab-26-like n=1 Tax=Zeugodacus cucurbitae TaxID=28588 RepID=UPI0023D960C1|nr:ras-related protein Rab-26-like [Zeugodacus cucurbitae]
MSHIPDDASSMSDDVFEDPETQQRRLEETARYRANYTTGSSGLGGGGSSGIGSSLGGSSSNAFSTGYPGYRPPVKALQMYALEDAVFHGDGNEDEYEDGWRSYRYDEVGMYSQPPQPPFDDTVNHKTILLGDSGVGKTSFLVKYNTGEFRLGSFSATVGIALTE